MFENKQWRKIAIDKDKIDALIQENYMSIYKYCFYHVHNRDVAQDITQDVFLKFIKEIKRYREYGKLKNYLYVIARNSIRDHARKIKEIDLETDFEAENGISSIILQYDLLIIACAFLGVLISCECSMKKKKMQYEYKIEVKNLWQFKYYQSAYSSTRLSNLSLRINWEYDISNTNYDLFQ